MLDVRRLRLLREVAAQGSIAGAARSLAFTPSAVSQQLAKLERETGVALLERGAKNVRLTEAGRVLVDHTSAILDQLARAEADIRSLSPRDPEQVRLVTFATAGAVLVPPALERLSHERPGADVSVIAVDPVRALALLTDGEADLALAYEYDFVPLVAPPGITLELLLEEELFVLLPRSHPLAGSPEVSLADLAGETWIKSSPHSPCTEFTGRACRAAGFEPRIRNEFEDYQTLQGLVGSGLGVGFAPQMVLRPLHAAVVARPVAPNPPRRRVYAARHTGDGRPVLDALVVALRDGADASARRSRMRAVEGARTS
jgi:DNA-binding transcriptional LysR family regulator